MEGLIQVKRAEQKPHEMTTAELEKLERILRNMPVTSAIELGTADSEHGRIYMAWGTDAMGVYHGIWGARGFAIPLEFFPEVRNPNTVRDSLLTHAAEILSGLATEGLLYKGWWDAGR